MARGRKSLEESLGTSALADIARRYFLRESSTEIAADYGFRRQVVPRLARAGLPFMKQEAPSASTERG